MTKHFKRALILFSLSHGLAACSSGGKWYDYGNGMINLETISIIKSEGSLSLEATPLSPAPEDWESKAGAIYRAHERFCQDAVPTQKLSEQSFSELTQNTDFMPKVRASVEQEIFKTCKVSLTGQASIKFDDFTLFLDAVDINLNQKFGAIEPSKLGTAKTNFELDQVIKPWVDAYAEVQKKAQGAVL